jgi:hypothetical protein
MLCRTSPEKSQIGGSAIHLRDFDVASSVLTMVHESPHFARLAKALAVLRAHPPSKNSFDRLTEVTYCSAPSSALLKKWSEWRDINFPDRGGRQLNKELQHDQAHSYRVWSDKWEHFRGTGFRLLASDSYSEGCSCKQL